MAVTSALHFDNFVETGLCQVLPLDKFVVYLLSLYTQADESFRQLVQILKLFIDTTMSYTLCGFL